MHVTKGVKNYKPRNPFSGRMYHLPRIWTILGLFGIVITLIMYVIGLASEHSKDWINYHLLK